MKKVSSCFILSFLLLLIASLPSYAESKASINKAEKRGQDESPSPMIMPMMSCGKGQMKGMPELKHLQSLNLDEKQKEAFKEIESSVTKELIRKRADEQIAEIELRELLDQGTVDLKAVEKKRKQIAAVKTETRLIVIKSMENMKAKLTLEQREMLNKMRPALLLKNGSCREYSNNRPPTPNISATAASSEITEIEPGANPEAGCCTNKNI